MEVIQEHIVSEITQKVRLSDYGVQAFNGSYSKSALKKMIKRGELWLNGKKGRTADFVQAGDKIAITAPQNKLPMPISLDLDVAYEDDYLAIVLKPAGIPVSGNQHRTIQNALLNVLTKSSQPDALGIPRPAHRLDALTSGLLLVGKTSSTLLKLNKVFEEKQIEKTYFALVVGEIGEQGEIAEAIDGKPAFTAYKRLSLTPSLKTAHVSLVELKPKTGRTHQLRKHLAVIGHPILGDTLYTKDSPLLKGKGLFLSAVGLSFVHPVTGEYMKLKLPLPAKFKRRLAYEQQRWEKFN